MGGVPATEQQLGHKSEILDCFMPKADVEAKGLMAAMQQNYLDKQPAPW